MHKVLSVFWVVTLALFLSGCLSTAGTNPSGFLTAYNQFKPGPEGGVERVWVASDIRTFADFKRMVAPYRNIIIDPVVFVSKEDEAYAGLSEAERKALGQELTRKLKETLQDRFVIVSRARAQTLRMSVAISAIEIPNPILATTSSVLPVGLGISMLSKYATGEHTNVGSASVEIIVSDAQTKRTLFAVLDRKAGNKDLGTIMHATDDARDAFDWWAKRMRKAFAL